jgi:UDP-N-acetylglucosamine--N-acetylmuramyl-(pentapeptide) pyrophosphoryl-undecaprenol N-acetylglucosamine transferase
MDKKKIRALIAAGGTGGHLFPAMAVAEQLQILTGGSFHANFVGTSSKIESKVVPNSGYDFTPIPITGFKGIFSIDTLSLPYKILRSEQICRNIIKKNQINVVICTGAYISYPAGNAAFKENIPLVLMESNLTPGKAIRMLSSKASLIITAFPDSEKYYPSILSPRIKPLGNPVRKSILNISNRQAALNKFNLESEKNTILIFGGSLGAKSINHAAVELITALDSNKYQFIWQTGRDFQCPFADIDNLWSGDFIEDMASAYAAADLVLSRSGATTISELCVAGKAAILVPYPSASNNEQELNAQYLVDNDAAILIHEDALQENIVEIISELSNDKYRLKAMSEAALSLGKPNCSVDSANSIIALVENL